MANTTAARQSRREFTAFLDGEDSPTISNPIHSTQIAREYGFEAALVGGVTVYGWATRAIRDVAGDEWLRDGWIDVAFRAPVYPGDHLWLEAGVDARGQGTMAVMRGDTACLRGTFGPGQAPWLAEFRDIPYAPAEPLPATLPRLTLESARLGEPLRPLGYNMSREEAAEYATTLQRDPHEPWLGDDALVHPGWLAGRMTRLIHHSYDYGPSIHTRSQIQHLAPVRAGQLLTACGTLGEVIERNRHHYAVADGAIFSEAGDLLVRLRHTTIFRVAPKN